MDYQVINIVGMKHNEPKSTISIGNYDVWLLDHRDLTVSRVPSMRLPYIANDILGYSSGYINWRIVHGEKCVRFNNLFIRYKRVMETSLNINGLDFSFIIRDNVLRICDYLTVYTLGQFFSFNLRYMFRFEDIIVIRFLIGSVDRSFYVLTLLFDSISGCFIGAFENSNGVLRINCPCNNLAFVSKFELMTANMGY